MKIVATSYMNTPEFNDPDLWLDRINFYTGILEELSRQHEVISIEQINYAGGRERKGVFYHFLNFKKRKLYFPKELNSYIKKLNPDIILIQGLLFPFQVIQLRRAVGKKVKIIMQHHAEKPATGIRKWLQRRADRCTDAYLFTSHDMGMEWVKEGIIVDKKTITEVMEASSVFVPVPRETALSVTKVQGSPVFLWVGRLNENKDPLAVLAAFLQFVKQQPGARLYMIYQTEELLPAVMDMLASQEEGKDAVRLVGKVAHIELQDWYNSADFIISGSHYEGSGIAVCEAMSCGCIPIVTNISSFKRMTAGKCGLLYEAGNVKELLAALLQTREMDLAKERAAAMMQFRRELSFEAIANKINQVISGSV